MGHGGEGEKEEGTGRGALYTYVSAVPFSGLSAIRNFYCSRGGGGGGGGGDNLFQRGINYSGIIYPGDKLFRNRLSGG